jgi:hypothetical protein
LIKHEIGISAPSDATLWPGDSQRSRRGIGMPGNVDPTMAEPADRPRRAGRGDGEVADLQALYRDFAAIGEDARAPDIASVRVGNADIVEAEKAAGIGESEFERRTRGVRRDRRGISAERVRLVGLYEDQRRLAAERDGQAAVEGFGLVDVEIKADVVGVADHRGNGLREGSGLVSSEDAIASRVDVLRKGVDPDIGVLRLRISYHPIREISGFESGIENKVGTRHLASLYL